MMPSSSSIVEATAFRYFNQLVFFKKGNMTMHAAIEQPNSPDANYSIQNNNSLAASMDDIDVEVWVCDGTGTEYSVTLPISSTFCEVMETVTKRYRLFQGIYVGVKGGEGGWNMKTCVSEMLPKQRPKDFNVAAYFKDHPIQPKFKDSLWFRLWRWIIANVVAFLALVIAIVSLIKSTKIGD